MEEPILPGKNEGGLSWKSLFCHRKLGDSILPQNEVRGCGGEGERRLVMGDPIPCCDSISPSLPGFCDLCDDTAPACVWTARAPLPG